MGEHDDAAGLRDVSGPREEISPQREAALLEATLRYQISVDPSQVGPVLDLAAVGIVNSAWRNSPVEDWHAGDGPLTDGEMLRVNAHTTWRVREVVRRWRAEMGLTARSPMAAVDGLDTDHVGWLAVRIFRWLVNPGRRLPTGVTLADLAGADLGEFTEHVDGMLGGCAATAEPRRRMSPTGPGCGDSSSTGPEILNRWRRGVSSTPALATSVRHYHRYPTIWCLRRSRQSDVGLASRTGRGRPKQHLRDRSRVTHRRPPSAMRRRTSLPAATLTRQPH